MKIGVLNTPKILELKRKKRRRVLKKIFIVFSSLLFVFLIACFFTFWKEIHITNIEINGNKVIESDKIRTMVEDELSKPFLFFFKKDNFFFYPKSKIKNVLYRDYKRISDLDISLKNINTLRVDIKERDILYTWCGEAILEDPAFFDNQKCFFLDKTGFIFDQAPYFSEGVYLKIFGKIENKESPIGNYLFKEDFYKIIYINDFVQDLDLPLSTMSLSSDAESNIYLFSKKTPPNAPKIIFDLKGDIEKQFDNLESSFSLDSFSELYKEKFDSLLYIDLRFNNKVFHKFE